MDNFSSALLTIDLNIIKSNYQRLRDQLGGKDCAAVVKADAYGLGIKPVSKTLWESGARTFFVALPEEGIELRQILPDADIHVLVGVMPETEEIYLQHELVPVLNSLEQIERWGHRGRCDLHIDTGMTRLGLAPKDISKVPATLDVDILMSHFACADEKDHLLNNEQIAAFQNACHAIAHKRASLANSSGIFLNEDAQFDLGRPGCALYGINPTPDQANPMGNPVRLQGKIVQVHEIDTQHSVGYGATHALQAGQKLATIALGYADGYLRSLSSSGVVYVDEAPAPVVGRVSMDLITIDVTDIEAREGQLVDVIGPHNPPDQIAKQAGTIGYEILTSLGRRYKRIYKG
ncbi:alanine racemase [Terasakiella sp. SH-1]|uniref:alanine racemase n=1 Tax=Terasakiella sp. SH-1 TaxID=2560057 RepID=UPI001073DB40|nr:alanine racemase [Terasakiella sp. SH-1]